MREGLGAIAAAVAQGVMASSAEIDAAQQQQMRAEPRRVALRQDLIGETDRTGGEDQHRHIERQDQQGQQDAAAPAAQW